jgi:hypothetical protein
MRLATVALLSLFLTAIVLAGQAPQSEEKPSPFGLQMGMAKDQIGRIEKEISPYKFQLASVSKPHPDLETYVVSVTPNTGLCFIRAVSPDWKTSQDGSLLKSKFEAMKSQVEGIYGKPYVNDSLQSGSKLDKPKDWMTALLKNERALFARWSAADNLTMKPTITKIYVAAYPVSRDSGYLAVEFYFNNYDQCEAELKARP